MMQCNILSKVQNTYPKPICDRGHQESISQIKTPKKQGDKKGLRKTKRKTNVVVRFDQLNLVL